MMGVLTSTLITNWAVGKVAAFGNGNGDFRLDARALGSVGKQNSAETARVCPYSLYLLATTIRNRSFGILCSNCARGKVHCLSIWSRLSTWACPINPINADKHCKQSQDANELHWSPHFFASKCSSFNPISSHNVMSQWNNVPIRVFIVQWEHTMWLLQ